MMLTLLTITATCVVLTSAYVLIAKNQPAEALAGETTISTRADAASETIITARQTIPTEAVPTEWQLTSVASLSEAEDFLDVLENQGFAERELVVLGNSTFAIRWR